MRVLFGVLSLLVVLAVLGAVVGRQMKALQAPPRSIAAPVEAAPAASAGAIESPLAIQRRLTEDVKRSMQQAPSRIDPAEAP